MFMNNQDQSNPNRRTAGFVQSDSLNTGTASDNYSIAKQFSEKTDATDMDDQKYFRTAVHLAESKKLPEHKSSFFAYNMNRLTPPLANQEYKVKDNSDSEVSIDDLRSPTPIRAISENPANLLIDISGVSPDGKDKDDSFEILKKMQDKVRISGMVRDESSIHSSAKKVLHKSLRVSNVSKLQSGNSGKLRHSNVHNRNEPPKVQNNDQLPRDIRNTIIRKSRRGSSNLENSRDFEQIERLGINMYKSPSLEPTQLRLSPNFEDESPDSGHMQNKNDQQKYLNNKMSELQQQMQDVIGKMNEFNHSNSVDRKKQSNDEVMPTVSYSNQQYQNNHDLKRSIKMSKESYNENITNRFVKKKNKRDNNNLSFNNNNYNQIEAQELAQYNGNQNLQKQRKNSNQNFEKLNKNKPSYNDEGPLLDDSGNSELPTIPRGSPNDISKSTIHS